MSKTLLFDFGNVLINIDVSKTRQAFEHLGASQELEFTSAFEDFDRGIISEDAFLIELKSFFPKRILKTEIKNAWNALLLELPDSSIKLLKMLKRDGHKLYLLSNTCSTHIKCIEQNTGLFKFKVFSQLFEHMFYSFHLRVRKPEPEIFLQVMKFINEKPQNCILIDDLLPNLEQAKALGIQTIHFALDKNQKHSELIRTITNIS